MIYIFMGVAGCGKTTVGKLFASKKGLSFFDADDFHPPSNILKMNAGKSLNDEDRLPWLELLNSEIVKWEEAGGAVLACSALKKRYRQILEDESPAQIKWIYLHGTYEMILQRLKSRTDHYFRSELLVSQFNDLEKPAEALQIDISNEPEKIVQLIMENEELLSGINDIGIIGLGVMGRNLALNAAEKGFAVAVYNREVKGSEEKVAQRFVEDNSNYSNLHATHDLSSFVSSLDTPRKILIMVKAGEAVDLVIDDLIPLLQADDILIDGGNSHFMNSQRRALQLQPHQINFIGMGVSGGEMGARYGPSLMPGGSALSFIEVQKLFDSLAAKDKNGNPCCSWMGGYGSGHFIKMIHNGIEYAEMQIIAEIYFLLKTNLKLNGDQIADLFQQWIEVGNRSYLLEITEAILRKKEGSEYLLDKVADVAGQKGTGSWSVVAALELGAPANTIVAALMARQNSGDKDARIKASLTYQENNSKRILDSKSYAKQCQQAMSLASWINHSIGFDILNRAIKEHTWQIKLSEIARVWTGGCIIRSKMMEELVDLFEKDEYEHLLLHGEVAKQVLESLDAFKKIVISAVENEIAVPVLSASLNYFFQLKTADSSANLIQAQRDYFGAHGYQRRDKPGDQVFHSSWDSE